MFRNLKSRRRRRYNGRAGINNPDFDDTKRYYCRVCGFTCNADKVRVRDLTNKDTDGDWKSGITYRASDESADYVNITSGCPQCGSFDSK